VPMDGGMGKAKRAIENFLSEIPKNINIRI